METSFGENPVIEDPVLGIADFCTRMNTTFTKSWEIYGSGILCRIEIAGWTNEVRYVECQDPVIAIKVTAAILLNRMGLYTVKEEDPIEKFESAVHDVLGEILSENNDFVQNIGNLMKTFTERGLFEEGH